MAGFRLQRVLDLRKRKEEELQQRLALAAGARVRAEVELQAQLDDEQRRREEIAALLRAGRIDPGQLRELGQLLEARGQAIVRQREAVVRAVAFEEEERARLVHATVERRALDTLRERHEERERTEARRVEAVLIDEIAGNGAARVRLATAAAGRQ
jgi:flagellar export protein FliJ